mmetsp:Transcript_29111/g.89166  ORF Transcript_29111/g.89166 Transcript_29111/m.89166 type:complete len:239 (+) Transcript_29111:1233-1949(+)
MEPAHRPDPVSSGRLTTLCAAWSKMFAHARCNGLALVQVEGACTERRARDGARKALIMPSTSECRDAAADGTVALGAALSCVLCVMLRAVRLTTVIVVEVAKGQRTTRLRAAEARMVKPTVSCQHGARSRRCEAAGAAGWAEVRWPAVITVERKSLARPYRGRGRRLEGEGIVCDAAAAAEARERLSLGGTVRASAVELMAGGSSTKKGEIARLRCQPVHRAEGGGRPGRGGESSPVG